jgi:thiol-disulfide isomerase/thioredoxin
MSCAIESEVRIRAPWMVATALALAMAGLVACGDGPSSGGPAAPVVEGTGGERSSGGREVELEGLVGRRVLVDPLVGKKAPELSLSGWMNSEPLALPDLRGSVVLLDFFGAWCPPCRALTPYLVELHRKYADRGLRIVGVHTQRGMENGPAYVEEAGIPYPVGIDSEGKTVEAYRVDGFPDLYLVDREGILRYADIKTNPRENIVAAIENLLEE